MLRAGAILGRPLHIICVGTGMGDARYHGLIDIFRLHLELVFHVNRAGRNEGVDPPSLGRLNGFGGAINIGKCSAIDIGFSEDIKVGASPDIGLLISWKSQYNGCN